MAVRPPLNLSPQLRAALAAGVSPDFPGQATGSWQSFNVISQQFAPGGTDSPTLSFPVTSALYEVEGAALVEDQDITDISKTLGNTDAFTIQIVYADGTQLNAGAINASNTQLLGSAFFPRLDGVYKLRKPQVIGPNQSITINLKNISQPAANITVYLRFTVLQLELATNAVQF